VAENWPSFTGKKKNCRWEKVKKKQPNRGVPFAKKENSQGGEKFALGWEKKTARFLVFWVEEGHRNLGLGKRGKDVLTEKFPVTVRKKVHPPIPIWGKGREPGFPINLPGRGISPIKTDGKEKKAPFNPGGKGKESYSPDNARPPANE